MKEFKMPEPISANVIPVTRAKRGKYRALARAAMALEPGQAIQVMEKSAQGMYRATIKICLEEMLGWTVETRGNYIIRLK